MPFNNPLRISFYSFLITIVISAAACASAVEMNGSADGSNRGEGKGGNGNAVVVKKDAVKYEDFLVDINSYSTNGGFYQNKYKKDIISIAKDITENQDIDVSKGSMGFYFDKKSKRTDRLFFGFDIIINKDNNLEYSRFSVKLIQENVTGIIDEIYKYKFVTSENEVVGVVIGFKWMDAGTNQQVNIWIKKEDIALFLNERLTANEMFQRGTITNSAGRVILLPL
ncbi:MAG TPA: hypothetical protein PKZ64_05215 [Spirochaetota bacterium]|nr:hypothetical protein [Spirochaetota bacterium]HPR36442.1 hypothetical protein [Spirochaetota bacterium]